MAGLVDTGVLIELERRGESPARAAEGPEGPFAVSSITVAELLVGTHRADSLRRREIRQAFLAGALEALPVVAFDLPEARIYAALWSELAAAGRMIGIHDLQIAATAVAHGYHVVTLNVRDLERVPGLVVHRPEW